MAKNNEIKFLMVLLVVVLVLGSFYLGTLINNQAQSSTNKVVPMFLNNPYDVRLEQATSQEEIKTLLASTNNNNYGVMLKSFGGEVRGEVLSMDSGVAEAAVPQTTSSKQAIDFSRTNNQVVNVDEADMVKTDGQYLYVISKGTLFVLKAYPGEEAEVISKLSDDDVIFKELFINDDKAVVIGDAKNNDKYSFSGTQLTVIRVYDIKDKKKIKLLKELTVEGSYYTGRMNDNKVLVVSKKYYYDPVIRLPIIMKDGRAEEIMPRDFYYLTKPYDNLQTVILARLDLDSLVDEEKIFSLSNLKTVYASEMNVYLVDEDYLNREDVFFEFAEDNLFDKLPLEDKERIRKIREADPDLLSPQEKKSKIMAIYQSFMEKNLLVDDEEQEKEFINKFKEYMKKYQARTYSTIIKVSWNDGLSVRATTTVEGELLNQFSLDENNGYLRTAMTVTPNTELEKEDREIKTTENRVVVFDEDLKIKGELTGVAKDERIFSARFMGDKLYLVTFKQIDPFFVIDLSNPEKPSVLGELKIPGFSTYLHPYDENTIIGLGRGDRSLDWSRGLKISLFDVSDFSNPKEITSYELTGKYAHSVAEYEHRAFLFSKEKNLLVIPAYLNDKDESYNGALVFNITRNKIELKGLIDHSQGRDVWMSGVQRSLYINDLLYTVSTGLVRINRISDLSSVKDIPLTIEKEGEIPVY